MNETKARKVDNKKIKNKLEKRKTTENNAKRHKR